MGWWLQEKRVPLSGGPCGKARMTDVKGSHEAEGWRAGPAGTPGPADRQDGDFFFFIFKKKQNFKNICLFRKISKIYPGRPLGGDRP